MKHKFLFWFLGLSVLALGQDAGNTGLSFLKIGSGARNLSLGNCGTVFANDAGAVFYNPANLQQAGSDQVILSHSQWIQDVNSEMIAARITMLGLPIGIGINSTAVNDIEIRTTAGPKQGTFNAHYFAGSIGTAVAITDDITAGAAFKYLYEGLYTEESNGQAVDFGITWRNVYDKFTASLAVANLGSMDKLAVEKTTLPADIRVGVLYPAGIVYDKIALTAGAEFQKYFDAGDSHVNIGAEAWYDQQFALRLGYMANYETRSFSAGAGTHWKNIDFDYAFVPFSEGLGSAHNLSVKICF